MWRITSVLLSVAFAGSILAGQNQTSPGQPVPAAGKQPPKLAVASVALQETKLQNVEVFGWGKPSEKDVRTIREALEKEIAPFALNASATSGEVLKLWVVVRRYLVTTTNSASAGLASVAWCAAYDADRIVFHEEFYAAKHKNMGFVKGGINKAIALRIGDSARRLATLEPGTELREAAVKDTYLQFSEAQARAGKLLAAAPPGWVWTDGYMKYHSIHVDGGWDWTQHPDRINWKEYIAGAQAAAK